MENKEIGYLKGESCNRDGCVGVIDEHESESSCSCHINPPCSYCTDSREYCPVCEWDGREEQLEKQYKPLKNDAQSVYNRMMAKEDTQIHKIDQMRAGKLPVDKLTWYSKGHTHFSMEKIGAFPKGATRTAVESEVKGTFGGRFTEFNTESGRFTYIAYTD